MCSEGSCFGLQIWSDTATKQAAGWRTHDQLGPMISERPVQGEGCTDMAGELPNTSDQGRGVVQLEHLIVSGNGVISNVKPSERYGPLVLLGPDH